MAWNPFKVFKKDRKLTSGQIKSARSTKHLFSGKIPSDPKKALAMAEAELKKAGYKFVRRTSTFDHGRKFTMTLRKRIALSGKWDTYSTDKKAEILWHELVHVRQRKAWGHTKFLRRYATAEGRWMIEVPAYRESIRMKKLFAKKYTKKNVEDYVEAKIDSMRDSYALKRLSKSHYERETRKIWMKEAA
jgi:hypothetical protein